MVDSTPDLNVNKAINVFETAISQETREKIEQIKSDKTGLFHVELAKKNELLGFILNHLFHFDCELACLFVKTKKEAEQDKIDREGKSECLSKESRLYSPKTAKKIASKYYPTPAD